MKRTKKPDAIGGSGEAGAPPVQGTQGEASSSVEASTTIRPEPEAARPSNEQIARRAYEIFLARGGREGLPLEDWLRAEKELQGR